MRAPVLMVLTFVCGVAAAAEAPAKADSADDANQMVCFVEPSTGSHIKKRVCMSEADYAARKKADQEAMMKMKGVASAERQKGAGTLR